MRALGFWSWALVFLSVGITFLAFGNTIQQSALLHYKRNASWLKADVIQRWIGSQSFVTAVRLTGACCILAVALAAYLRFGR